MSQPIKLQWPPRDRLQGRGSEGRGGEARGAEPSATLVVRVETGFALELQHLSGAVIERVNAHLGWRCVSRLTLKQGPVERRAAARPTRFPPDPDAAKEAEGLVAEIRDDALRQALARLGAHALSRRSRRA